MIRVAPVLVRVFPALLVPSLLVLAALAGCAPQAGPEIVPGSGQPLRGGLPGLNVADAALTSGVPETALMVTRGLLARNPRDANALIRQGEALVQLGRDNEAVDSFNRAIVIAPGASPAHLGLARLLLMRGDAAKAETELTKVLDKDPRDVAALVNIGIARDLLGHHDEAQKSYQRALELSPGLVAARIDMGLSQALAGRGDQAAETLRPIAEQPNAPRAVRHDLAVALAVAGKTAEAERVMGNDLPSSEIQAAVALYRSMGEHDQ
jgi:Flp pilus assembly protein TadD